MCVSEKGGSHRKRTARKSVNADCLEVGQYQATRGWNEGELAVLEFVGEHVELDWDDLGEVEGLGGLEDS